MEFTFAFCLFATCHSEMAMNPSSSQRASWSTLSRRRDKPWRITDQKAPSPGLRMLVTKTARNSQGSHASWKVLEIPGILFVKFSGPGKSWKMGLVLESPGNFC